MVLVLTPQSKTYFVALGTVLLLDMIWIGLIAKSFYTSALGDLARVDADGSFSPLLTPALGVYLLIPAGLCVFAVPKILDEDPLLVSSLKWGGGFGLVVYGTYELTNLSILKDYSAGMVAVDTMWGVALCSAASGAAAWFSGRYGDRGAALAENYAQF